MLVPLNWLREYVKDELSTEDLTRKLTDSGSSVERVMTVGKGLDDLIVGLVEEVRPHPNADRLRLAKVNIGSEVVEVVCGATNLESGQHIVYAGEGSHLPVNMHDDERQPFVLKKATIRGVESNGMICSVAEMGIGEDHDGILVLPESAKIGQKITQALDYPQVVLDIEVTTNRSDELSMIGLAREVSALTGKPLLQPEVKLPIIASKSKGFEPLVQTPHCFRLITQQLKVSVGPSPWWMQQRLALSGMRPINNIVDITNYVMLEYGQPLHAYDAAKLSGNKLIARQAASKEKLQTLDGVDRQLSSDMMVIADENQVLGVAGIMGGETSKTSTDTTEIVLEAAAFDPIAIRKTANQLALRSEASRRFERSVDREQTVSAMARAVDLLIKYADAQIVTAAKDSYPVALESKQVTLRAKRLNQYLGQQVDPSQVLPIFKSLGFGDVQAFGNDTEWEISVRVPSWRSHDILEEVDLVEEVIRMVGYSQLDITLPGGELPAALPHQGFIQRQLLRNALARAGWSEIITVSLVGETLHKQLQMPMPTIALANPLSADWTHLRHSLLPGLIKSAGDNIRWEQSLRLFELSSVYENSEKIVPTEKLQLGLILASRLTPEFALAETKGIVEYSLQQLGVSPTQIDYESLKDVVQPYESGQTVGILIDGTTVGKIGLLPQFISEPLRLPESAFIAEIDLDALPNSTQAQQLQSLPVSPSLEEDISIVATESTPVADVLAIILKAGKPLLESAELSQIYRNPKLGESAKSITFHLRFRDPSRTLTSNEVGQTRQKIVQDLAKEGMHVRD